jgi:hypothetical protein
MNAYSKFKTYVRSLFQGKSAGDDVETLRAECLYLTRLADFSAEEKRSWTDLIGEAQALHLRALAPVLRERTTRRVNGMELPDTGRSSIEGTLADTLGSSLAFWGTVSPVIDFEMLSLLKHLSIHNPDMSQYVTNVINLGNTGHTLTVDASSNRRAEQAVKRLNESASRLYRNGAGIDGLINSYLRQIAVFGALSSEDVVDFSQRRVDKVVIVPVEQIRFRYLEGEYVPHQQPRVAAGLVGAPLGLVRLSDETYRYYALDTVENSPYAKPPASAAVQSIVGPQTDMLKNISYIVKKFGFLGVMTLKIVKPAQGESETDDQYLSRLRTYQKQVATAAQTMSSTGLVVTYDDQTVEHNNVTGDAAGAADIYEKNEQQVFSGMGTFGAFHGRTDSTTETYANVVYNFMRAQSGNMQRLPKRRQERTYMLDLRLGGLEVDGVTLGFNQAHARDPKGDAEADKTKWETALAKAQQGALSPNDAAQELGYDSWYDPELLKAIPAAANALKDAVQSQRAQFVEPLRLQFNRDSQRYRLLPSVIEVSSALSGETFNPSSNGHQPAVAA